MAANTLQTFKASYLFIFGFCRRYHTATVRRLTKKKKQKRKKKPQNKKIFFYFFYKFLINIFLNFNSTCFKITTNKNYVLPFLFV